MVTPVSRWISRVLRYSGIQPIRSPPGTGLSPCLVGLPRPFPCLSRTFRRTLQPRSVDRFRLLRVRSPLLTESSLFLGLLRCFSSPGSLVFRRALAFPRAGFPIRISLALAAAHASPELFAVYHVLLRHLTPRHPPCALIRFFTFLLRVLSSGDADTLTTPAFSRQHSAFSLKPGI